MGIAHETRERGVKTKLADDDDNDNLCDGTASTAASSRRMPLIKKPRRFVGNGVAFPFLKADGGLPSSSTKDEVKFNAEKWAFPIGQGHWRKDCHNCWRPMSSPTTTLKDTGVWIQLNSWESL